MASVPVAKVALSAATYAIDKPYDYRIPPELAESALPGVRVMVPFGRGNRRTEGLILTLEESGAPDKLKSVLRVLDDSPVLDAYGIKLALYMRDRCFCTVYEAVRAMLPAGLWFSLRDSLFLAPGVTREAAYEAAGKSEHAKRILDMLFASNGSIEIEAVKDAVSPKDPNPAVRQLVEGGILSFDTGVKRKVGDKTEQLVSLCLPQEEAMAAVTPKRNSAPLRYAVTERLCALGKVTAKELCYFTGASSATLRSLEKSGMIRLEKLESLRRLSLERVEPASPVVLNDSQRKAYEGLDALCLAGKPAASLLYGVTGSGKTQVYIRLMKSVLSRGRTALVLVPEIALTPQLLRVFLSHFGDSVAVLHSSLRAGERYDEWKRIKSGKATVVIGTRSAVFAPLSSIGLIILDEEQEATYKSENSPRYHAREVAKYRCVQHGALLLLGSATPAVETMYEADTGAYHKFTLSDRYNEMAMPDVFIADMKDELRAGNGTSISMPLRRELEYNIKKGEQSILFINRRGASRMISCGECGAVPACPRCSVHLTYHSANGRLMCHYCGHSEKLPDSCPDCGGTLNFIGTGTQKVQEELETLFPGVEVLRMDADTITATHSHEAVLNRFQNKKVPILLGTQMVAKGLDFENVTLVGVIAADLSLYVDSFLASERTFSLLTQVVGRAGRGEKAGRAVIQTWTPENEIIKSAARQDYDSFYRSEIEMRRLRRFPPFSDLLFITASGPDEGAVLLACQRLRQGLDDWLKKKPYAALDPVLLGPAPASVAKVNNRYRYRLILNCPASRELRFLVAHLLRVAQTDRENRGVSVYANLNPID